jgi:hypothetical protein
MYCGSVMCNDEELNVVICSLNANFYVYVHEDLHEIHLLNVNALLSIFRKYIS